MIRLGVNVDHVATVRQARGIDIPDPVEVALLAERGGADGVTVHLREDRRHIQERDVELLRQKVKTKLNLEMAVTPEMARLAERFRPDDACFVPERREELTTEGGLDVLAHRAKVQEAVRRLQGQGIRVSLFVDPQEAQIEVSREVGAHGVEIHTGRYCNASGDRTSELEEVAAAASLARRLGLEVHGGHGLNYENVLPITHILEIVELNIGHSIVARAIMVGIEQAVREMKDLLKAARD
ncbi:MAG: pyridoxine 5'-phosphate synthase [Deltaproteobacteria bacterium]|nr:pyridoxine 5'-phosphate synthase [Deltaproteobacteria bacterium]MCZ6623128.1 pyridoxine 5'-phosphate synthase [Deltaproteobacteria bacterium]